MGSFSKTSTYANEEEIQEFFSWNILYFYQEYIKLVDRI